MSFRNSDSTNRRSFRAPTRKQGNVPSFVQRRIVILLTLRYSAACETVSSGSLLSKIVINSYARIRRGSEPGLPIWSPAVPPQSKKDLSWRRALRGPTSCTNHGPKLIGRCKCGVTIPSFSERIRDQYSERRREPCANQKGRAHVVAEQWSRYE